MVQDWSQITFVALGKMWQGLLEFLPRLAGVVIFFIIGWLIALALARMLAEVLKRLKFNQIFERTGWKEALEKAELKVNPSEFVGAALKWILVIVLLVMSLEILFSGHDVRFDFLDRLVAWLPNLIVSIFIFVVAVILTDIIEKIIRASVEKMGVGYAGVSGTIVRWAIYTFAGLAILQQLGITETIIDTLVKGFVWTITLSLGLAFGLGGKDAAARFISDVQKKISEK